jgi:hypothetical protein
MDILLFVAFFLILYLFDILDVVIWSQSWLTILAYPKFPEYEQGKYGIQVVVAKCRCV